MNYIKKPAKERVFYFNNFQNAFRNELMSQNRKGLHFTFQVSSSAFRAWHRAVA